MCAIAATARSRAPNRRPVTGKCHSSKKFVRIAARHACVKRNAGAEQETASFAPATYDDRYGAFDAYRHQFVVRSLASDSAVELVVQLDPDRTSRGALQSLIVEAIEKLYGHDIARRYDPTALIEYRGIEKQME